VEGLEMDYKPMTNDEFDNFGKVVKCNWVKCAGGMGLAGCGNCCFRGDFKDKNCPEFITDEEYEKKHIG